MINHPNRSTRYTVTSPHGDVLKRGLTVAEAARFVGNHGGDMQTDADYDADLAAERAILIDNEGYFV